MFDVIYVCLERKTTNEKNIFIKERPRQVDLATCTCRYYMQFALSFASSYVLNY